MCDHRGEPSVESSRGVEMGLSRSKAMRAVADREVVDLRAPVTDGDQASRPRNGSNGHGDPAAAVVDDEADLAHDGKGRTGKKDGKKKKDGKAGKAKGKKKAAKAEAKAAKKAKKADKAKGEKATKTAAPTKAAET